MNGDRVKMTSLSSQCGNKGMNKLIWCLYPHDEGRHIKYILKECVKLLELM